MTHKIALYQNDEGNWLWYIIPIHRAFDPLMAPDGSNKKIRDAAAAARKAALKRGVKIAYTYMERRPKND